MRICKRNDGWWIVDIPDGEPCGPYDTQAEAMDDMRGLRRFFRYGDSPQFASIDRRFSMKKADVKIGGVYTAKVSRRLVPVRIDATKGTGWSATNLVTGNTIYVKSAQRLRGKCTEADLAGLGRPTPKRRTRAATGATTSPTAATGAKSAKKATKVAAQAKGRNTGSRAATGGSLPATSSRSAKQVKPKRISGLTAAFMVLVDADAELSAGAIIEKAAEKGWWKSDAATPAATIYAAMIREIATKGDESRFERGAKRGTFRAICTPAQRRELFSKKA